MRRRGIVPALAAVLLFAAPIVVLIATRPTPTGRASTWSTDAIVRTVCWGLACACTAWLAITMLSCLVAFVRDDASAALRVAAGAPPIIRPVLQTLFAGAVAVAPITSEAAPPIRLHAGADGRLVEGGARVVTTTTSTSGPTTTTTTATTITTPPLAVPPPETIAPLGRGTHSRPARVEPQNTHVVRTGDNLWSIARAEVVRTTGDARPSNASVAAYWQRVIALNRATLRSGNPSLIFPGEIVALPNP